MFFLFFFHVSEPSNIFPMDKIKSYIFFLFEKPNMSSCKTGCKWMLVVSETLLVSE